MSEEDFEEGKRLRSSLFDLVVRKGGSDRFRLAMIIPKSRIRLATRRNRIRRLISTAVANSKGQLPQSDTLCIVKSDISEMKIEEITQALLKLLGKS